MIDISRFRIVYKERVLNAVCLDNIMYRQNEFPSVDSKIIVKPQFLTVIAINEDGNIIAITDEAWMFQFIPIVKKED